MKILIHTKPKILKGCNLKLGENPFWNFKTNELSFVDIKSKKFFIYKNKKLKAHNLPFNISCLIPTKKSGQWIAATQNQIIKIFFFNKKIKIINLKHFEEPKNNRFNDGKCDHLGRLWISSMDKNEKLKTGKLWCFKNSKNFSKIEKGFSIGNGIDWSPDKKKMYFVASDKRAVYSYKFNKKTGKISNKNVLIRVPRKRGFPDGICTDEDGYIWVAYWGGGCIARHTPKGKVEKIIKIPKKNVTSLCFGEKKLDTIFVTTAEDNLNSKLKKSGKIYRIKTNICGKKINYFL